MGINLGANKKYKYSCDICNFKCIKKYDYERHNATNKHKHLSEGNYLGANAGNSTSKQHICHCGNVYAHISGLYRHKKKCTSVKDISSCSHSTNDDKYDMLSSAVLALVKENQEFKQLLIDQNKQLMDLTGNIGNNNTTNSNNNSNNKFNMNFFLNETCKDAITMNDFIKTMEVSVEDFINTGNLGFVNGISKVMVERIKDMELHARPMHCTDLKRETVYIKDEDKWEKDEDKRMLRNAVKGVARKNHMQLRTWYENSKPEVEQIGSEECENYFKFYKASLGGYDKDEDKKFEDKIMRNVMKETTIDKLMTLE